MRISTPFEVEVGSHKGSYTVLKYRRDGLIHGNVETISLPCATFVFQLIISVVNKGSSGSSQEMLR